MTDAPSSASPLRYKRVILKLSGESLADAGGRGISAHEAGEIARQIKQAHDTGCEIAIVIGGGNILRGAQFSGSNALVHEATAHYMGMLATTINSLALQDALEAQGLQTRVMSAIPTEKIAETFIRRRALRHLSKGRVIVLAAGIGNPFVTTDTAAAQRALELEADVVLKATRVDGVYSDDPEKNPHAVLYESLTYQQVVEKKLKVMDGTAIALCSEHNKPILVFNFKQDGNIVRAISGETIGTWIGSAPSPSNCE
ncbi:UMP kinase [Novipirellula artificiosorum]|uniref:Uridylate kinase n=1 Tax=Novipirellula artificiosorum TaxID=2528016 RepID=A0A5C6E231_9BACT|nr:UMP kinase [Novipirellula artificiosorum]TWU42544.1 Uridylate kinase [Novipirellula artificiosorum]